MWPSVSLPLLSGLVVRGKSVSGGLVFGISVCLVMIYMSGERRPTGAESARIEKKGILYALGAGPGDFR